MTSFAKPDLERSLLGAIIVAPALFSQALELAPADFSFSSNAIIFREMHAIVAAGEIIDVATLVDRLESRGLLEQVGGEYLGRLVDGSVLANVPGNVKSLKAASRRRNLIATLRRATQKAENPSTTSAEVIAEVSTISADNSDGLPLKLPSPSWPQPLAREAFYGLPGNIVRTIEPHTEADPAALLIQFLAAFGNVIGSGVHFRAEADRHPLNLFAVLVGTSSKARKGTSWGHVERLVASIDPEWSGSRIQTGLSSGEGLIHALRDPTGDDPGIEDKRLFVMENEFASTLRVLARDGNTLSPILRNAWDGRTLQVLTKQSPCKATGAHVSLVAHVTKDELRRELRRTDAGNGFGNRFLWVCARRSKTLPEGGHVPEGELQQLEKKLSVAVAHARSVGDYELTRDGGAREIWFRVYADLADGNPGLFGAVTSRGEAQVMRLACLYSLLDCSPMICAEHLRAALSVWEYCEASSKFIFGDSLGDHLADELLRHLRETPAGLTRTELNNALGRNRAGHDIGRALSVLAEYNLAAARMQGTSGRTAERWFAARHVSGTSTPQQGCQRPYFV